MNSARTTKDLCIDQNDSGYRYSIEPFLLAHFSTLAPGHKVLDVGTGCGIIPLLMIFREPKLEITGIEIQDSAAEIAKKNVSKNQMPVKIIKGNFLDMDSNPPPEQFDLIVSNPPYRKINSGRTNPDPEKAIARHELKLNMQGLLDKAKALLKKDGHIILTYPPIRLLETMRELEKRRLFPSRIRFIHGHKNAEAKIFLVDAIKEKKCDLIVDSPLYVYNRDGSYTMEMQQIYDSFNCVDGTHHLWEK